MCFVLGPQPAGIYFAANRLAQLLAFFQTSHNLVLAHRFSGLWAVGARRKAEACMLEATRRTTWQTAIGAILLTAAAPQALALFGPQFTAAAPALRLLVLAAVVNAALGPADIALNMSGEHRAAMRASMVSLAISAIALTLGAIAGGTLGIAFAVLVATTVRRGLFWWLTVRNLSLRSDVLAACHSRRESRQEPCLP